ncbi:hypothetical protein SPRG_10171 [Saprolegnia parasitica CBS 223.65]|uniref:Uncharacterized protein n=1 Tax=Saprolegnia parasitica (strain CBS 223.65) TaxID=695850 RepID=A0A067C291_SAPPC|nr:hypothetical protein SPRG_10171 [Saprolegnia parasitica CBS 223.65]KDO24638.1 hypothetical protein SPRG_10171 [Saprolegnia parasitica CBS 223.65]|eukprot:XP_012204706.1 hypothetical protein SPRG_10171 [Saprolegnia parasitica CBS 223.65]
MVLRPAKLPPNKKTIEEVVLTRKTFTPHAHPATAQAASNRPTRARRRPVATAPTLIPPPGMLDAPYSAFGDVTVQALSHQLATLTERMETLEAAHDHHHVLEQDPFEAELAAVTQMRPLSHPETDPKMAAKVTHAVKEMHATVHRLDRVFFDITSTENKRSHAATVMVAAVRGYLVRKRHRSAMRFLGRWRHKCARAFVDSLARFSLRVYRADAAVDAMRERARLRTLGVFLEQLHDVVVLTRPVRRQRHQQVEARFRVKMAALLRSMFFGWKTVAIGPRSRKHVLEAYRGRYAKCRERLELLQRYRVISQEMVKDELQKDTIRIIRERSVYHKRRMYFRLLRDCVWLPLQANILKADTHFETSMVRKVATAWVAHFRNFQLEREIQKLNEKRTFERFPQHYNIRRIEYHYRRTVLTKHLRAWGQLNRRLKTVQKRYELAARRSLRHMLLLWRVRSAYQHSLRGTVIDEWRSYCHRVFQVPFQAWVLYVVRRKQRHTSQANLIRAYHRRQARHTAYSFFRVWKHQTMFGHVEGIHTRVQLISTLEQQKMYCLSLEANALQYQSMIADLQTALTDEQARLAAKEAELEKLVLETQATRFAMHNAEQQIARTQSLLNAVRDIHPGSIKRIERLYSQESVLAGELSDVVHFHIARTADDQAAEAAANEARVLQEHMQVRAEDDQRLLRRVKWVLSRLDLNYNYDEYHESLLGAPLHESTVPYLAQMNQMYALFEFLRSGETASLLEENVPMTKDEVPLGPSLLVPSDVAPESAVRRPNLIASDGMWHKFVQNVAQKFPPKRHVPIQDRIISYALNRDEAKRIAAFNEDKPTIYRSWCSSD